MIAGFGTINGHVGGIQCHVAGPSGVPPVAPPPQITAHATAAAEFAMHSNLCLHFQSQHYAANTMSTSGLVGGVTMGTNSLLTHPQMPVPQPPNIPLPQPPAIPRPQASTIPLPQPAIATPTAVATKPAQGGGFRKVCRTEDTAPCPFPGLAPGVLQMRVKEGSKIRNLMGFAMARMQGGPSCGAETGSGIGHFNGGLGIPGSSYPSSTSTGSSFSGLRQVVFSGSGRAVTKTITCAEIMKRKLGGLHQLTKLCYKGVREVWESQDSRGNSVGTAGTGSGELTVHRTVPSISILLSKDPLDPLEPGYQPPETLTVLWAEREEQSPPLHTVSSVKRPMLPEPPYAPHTGQPSAKRLCVGAGVPICCPAD